MGGTWVSKGAVETNCDKPITGGEVEGGFAAMGPDREKLCRTERNSVKVGRF